jgi:hypothetical protein
VVKTQSNNTTTHSRQVVKTQSNYTITHSRQVVKTQVMTAKADLRMMDVVKRVYRSEVGGRGSTEARSVVEGLPKRGRWSTSGPEGSGPEGQSCRVEGGQGRSEQVRGCWESGLTSNYTIRHSCWTSGLTHLTPCPCLPWASVLTLPQP